jgi:hypothetical protein
MGALDYALNTTGFARSTAGVVERSEGDQHVVVAINLTCIWLCMQYETPKTLKCGRGA